MDDHDQHQPNEQETALMAIRVQRAAEFRQQMDLIVLRSMARDAEQQASA
jgi:hypothetical protein